MIEITTRDNQLLIHKMARVTVEIRTNLNQMLLTTSALPYNASNAMKRKR